MNGLIEIVWCPNPLRPVADRQVRRLLSTGTDTLDSVIKRLGLHATPLVVVLNACEVQRRRWYRKRVRPGDSLVLMQRARGPETAAKIIMDFAWYEIAASAALYVLSSNFVIGLAISMLASSLSSSGEKQSAGNNDVALAAYGIEGGANQARPYAPLPLVLGEHRMFPDYASRPFSEFVVDLSTGYEVINSTPAYEERVMPTFIAVPPVAPETVPTVNSPWTFLGMSEAGDFIYYGDNATRTFNPPGPVGTVRPHTFIVRYAVDGTGNGVTTWEDWYVAPPSPPPDGSGDGGLGGTEGSGNNGGDDGAGTGE